MKTLNDIALRLRQQAERVEVTPADLEARSGVPQAALTTVLDGTGDYQVTTLLAVADRLGLELVFVPKMAAPALEAGETRPPVVKTAVRAAQDRLRQRLAATAAADDQSLMHADPSPLFRPALSTSCPATQAARARVPLDFPRTPAFASVPGAHPKLPARLVNGQYFVGLTPEELQARFESCQDLVAQLLPYCQRKQTQHPEWSQDELLSKVATAIRAKAAAGKEGWGLSEAELHWVLHRVRERLNESVG